MSIHPMIKTTPILTFHQAHFEEKQDQLVIEEPLEILLAYPYKSKIKRKTLSITMRTPGQDAALAIGFLFSEGIITDKNDITEIQYPELNQILIVLSKDISNKMKQLRRNFYTSSSCGVCGKTSMALVTQKKQVVSKNPAPNINQELIRSLPEKLRAKQSIFRDTGGIHAAGLFEASGNLLHCAEDIGRHNALDKLIGHFFQQDTFLLGAYVLVLSGRTSFELIQKATMAGISFIIAVGAPSSLAVEMANAEDITLLGFTGRKRFNVYAGKERVLL